METGRARPSRTMVLRLAETLDLPLRERNALLIAAGFAPVYRESRLDQSDLAPVRGTLERILRTHDPYPAFVLDRAWNILLANQGHLNLLPLLLPEDAALIEPVNVMRLVLHPNLLRPRIVNWADVAHVLGHRLRRQLRGLDVDAQVSALFEKYLAYAGVPEAMERVRPPAESAILIPMTLEIGGFRLSWFSTIATLGTSQDVTLDELRIESLFPADEPTERAARQWAGDSRAGVN